ncbi:MAG: CGCGG family rSAM-modified RiPP protein [Bacillota bacterium]
MERPVQDQIAGLRVTLGDPIAKSWSANFEQEPYLDRADLVLEDSICAIAATHPVDERHATFVNLVTPGELGDPSRYLVPALVERLGGTVRVEEVGECGCGGFVVRVWRLG